MRNFSLLSILLFLANSLPAETKPLEPAVAAVAARYLMADLSGTEARKSIRGTKALWVQVAVQKPSDSTGFDSLEADLKLTDMTGQLHASGFKIMDPAKRSLALGLRPTLILNVLYCPKGTEGSNESFYLVLARATQDVLPLGGITVTMTTWVKVSETIPASGDSGMDVAAIRSAARSLVASFISVAKDKDDVPAAKDVK